MNRSTHNVYFVNTSHSSGPHERFSTGQLYDNVKTTVNPLDDNDNGGEMNVQNRGSSGSGHGWSGVQIMLWNCNATRWRVHAANGAMSWAVGMVGEKGGFLSNRIPEPDGIHQSLGTFVDPRSLYYAQLKDSLGASALHSIVLPNQLAGDIWDELGAWMRDGLFGDAVVAWLDEPVVSVATGVSVGIGGMVRDLNLLGNAATYTWSASAGPGSATFGDTSLPETTVSFDAPGTYLLAFLVSDVNSSRMASLDVSVEGSATTTPAPPTTTTTLQATTTTCEATTTTVASEPSSLPSHEPSAVPSIEPSLVPSMEPSEELSSDPSESPSSQPSLESSTEPSEKPSSQPSLEPSMDPSTTPSTLPSDVPTQVRSSLPSSLPSSSPSPPTTTTTTMAPPPMTTTTTAPMTTTSAPVSTCTFGQSGDPCQSKWDCCSQNCQKQGRGSKKCV